MSGRDEPPGIAPPPELTTIPSPTQMIRQDSRGKRWRSKQPTKIPNQPDFAPSTTSSQQIKENEPVSKLGSQSAAKTSNKVPGTKVTKAGVVDITIEVGANTPKAPATNLPRGPPGGTTNRSGRTFTKPGPGTRRPPIAGGQARGGRGGQGNFRRRPPVFQPAKSTVRPITVKPVQAQEPPKDEVKVIKKFALIEVDPSPTREKEKIEKPEIPLPLPQPTQPLPNVRGRGGARGGLRGRGQGANRGGKIYPQYNFRRDLLRRQLEYCFSVPNLCRDFFMRAQMNGKGYIAAESLAGHRTEPANPREILKAASSSPDLKCKNGSIRKRLEWWIWVLPPVAGPEADSSEEELPERIPKPQASQPDGVEASTTTSTEEKVETKEEGLVHAEPDPTGDEVCRTESSTADDVSIVCDGGSEAEVMPEIASEVSKS